MTALIYAGVAATAVLSCAWDIRYRRIPNVLTFGSALLGIGLHAAGSGAAGAGFSAAGWAVGLALFLPWFLAGGMGGGDVKLLAAFGAWLGPLQIVWACLFAMLAGGLVAAIAVVASRHRPRAVASAVPIAAGVALALWLH